MIRRPSSSPSSLATAAASAGGGPHFAVPGGTPTLRDLEMHYIQVVLEKHNGNKPAASKELGISLKTLYNKINQLQQS
jgi:transcriptional regulator with PAS, ATPase and Fis domain